MKPEDINARAQNALTNDTRFSWWEHYKSRIALGIGLMAVPEGLILDALSAHDPRALVLVLGVLIGGVWAAVDTRDVDILSRSVDKALETKNAYQDFAEDYVQRVMVSRFMRDFSVEDKSAGLGIRGKTSQVFQLHLAAELLDKVASYQRDTSMEEPVTIDERVRVILQKDTLPATSKAIAEKLRDQATQLYAEIQDVQKTNEGNWSLPEIINAAIEIGTMLGAGISGELSTAFDIQDYHQSTRRTSEEKQNTLERYGSLITDYVQPNMQFISRDMHNLLSRIKEAHQ